MEALKSNDLEKIKRLSDKEVDKNIIISPSKELEITGIKQVGSAQLGNKDPIIKDAIIFLTIYNHSSLRISPILGFPNSLKVLIK